MINQNEQLSISDQIRALAREGLSRSEIARRIDRSYQQVRQVLVADEARARRNAATTEPGVTRMADRPIDAIDVSDLGNNKSAKIRRYAALGFRRTAIADHLGIKYQFVRNVLVAEAAGKTAVGDAPGVREPATQAYDAETTVLPIRLNVDADGVVRLPPSWRIRAGQAFIARKFGSSIVLMDASQASEAARTGMNSASDELIAERRLEAMREFDD